MKYNRKTISFGTHPKRISWSKNGWWPKYKCFRSRSWNKGKFCRSWKHGRSKVYSWVNNKQDPLCWTNIYELMGIFYEK